MNNKCPKCGELMVIMGPYEAFEGYPHRKDHKIDGLDCTRRQLAQSQARYMRLREFLCITYQWVRATRSNETVWLHDASELLLLGGLT